MKNVGLAKQTKTQDNMVTTQHDDDSKNYYSSK
jgi:hypothetical protein